MQPSETIHIAIAADDRYLPHAAAMLHSLWWSNRSAAINVHFLHGPDLSQRKRRLFDHMVKKLGFKLQWLEVGNEQIQGLPSNVSYISKVVWYRLFMPQLFPQLDRILYLDCDVLVMDSIAPLWRTPLDENYFAAVTNVVPVHHSQRATELGLPSAECYFNLGIALWNLEIMRREGFTERVLSFARENASRLLWMEQDAINVLYWRERLRLHPRWNCQNGIFYSSWGTRLLNPQEIREAMENPALIHFEGGSFAKPWHYLSAHPLRKRYFFHRRRTPWPVCVPEGITLKNIAKKHLPAWSWPLLRKLRALRR